MFKIFEVGSESFYVDTCLVSMCTWMRLSLEMSLLVSVFVQGCCAYERKKEFREMSDNGLCKQWHAVQTKVNARHNFYANWQDTSSRTLWIANSLPFSKRSWIWSHCYKEFRNFRQETFVHVSNSQALFQGCNVSWFPKNFITSLSLSDALGTASTRKISSLPHFEI